MRRPGSPANHPGALEDHSFFRERMFRWIHLPGRPPLKRWTWVKLYALVTTAGMTLALFQVQANADRDRQRDTDRGYISCLTGNEVRVAMADVVRRAYTTGVTVDFTAVPGFDKLPAATRSYFQHFQDQLATAPNPADDPDSKLNQSLALLALRDCDAEFPTHTPGIDLPPRIPVPA